MQLKAYPLIMALVFCTHFVFGQLWTENFESYGDGATSGTAGGTVGGDWSSTVPGGGTFEKGSILGNRFYAYQTGGEGVWTTDPIDISGTGRAIIEMNVFGVLVGAGDYIQCYYTVDGGLPVLFFEQTGGLLNFTLTGTAIVTGSSMEIIVRSDVDGVLTSFSFDDVVVTEVITLYSRKDGNWDDATIGNGTWSAASLGGASCDCTPLTTDYLIIGNSNTVNINVSATAGGIEIQNTGALQWTASSIDLNIDRGILQVDVGGTISRNGQTGVQIDFDRGIVNSFINNGTVTSEDIEVIAANATLYISGSGSIALTGDFRIIEDDILVNNSLTGSFTIGDDLVFDQPGDILSDDAQFVNNGTLTISSDIVVGANNDDDNIFTNSVGATLSVVNLDFGNADFDFFNSGTVNQTGDFINIAAGDTNIDNLAGGFWNWSFVQATFDPQLNGVLNCAAVSNTFNYNAFGNQRIIPVSYNNLTLSVSGAKDANNASFSVSGDWTVSGATFTEGTGTITLNGNTAQSITNAAGETFNNLTINNSSAAGITFNDNVTVSAILTMTDGNVDLDGNTLTISSSAAGALVHSLASTAGWMYEGFITRNFAASTAIAVGNVRGFFPLGSSSDFRPFFVGVNSVAGTAGTITVSHTNSTSTSDVSIADANPVATILRRHDSFWTVATSTISAGAWDLRAGGTNFGTVGAVTDLRMSTTAGVVGTNATGTGSPSDPRVNRTGLTFGQLTNNFHLSSTDAINSPLPIELLEFTATLTEGEVQLKWVTASELNNDFFSIERGSSVESFESLFSVKGKGTVSEKNTYEAFDPFPLNGISYYRLKQTDFDGNFSYSPIRVIEYQMSLSVVLSPNPVSAGELLKVLVQGIGENEIVPITIFSATGARVFESVLHVDTQGYQSAEIEVQTLPKGVYFVRIGTFPTVTKRVIIN